MAAGKKSGQLSGEHLGITAGDDDIGIIFRIPVTDTFFEMLDFLSFVNENAVVFALDEASLNPCIQIILGFDILEVFFSFTQLLGGKKA